jgi:hypothetical protein
MHATWDDRLRIHSLHAASFKNKKIAEKVGYSEQRVSYLLKTPVFPQKRKGQPPIFNNAERQRLVEFITASPENRQLEYCRFPPEVSLNACERTDPSGYGHGGLTLTSATAETLLVQNKLLKTPPFCTVLRILGGWGLTSCSIYGWIYHAMYRYVFITLFIFSIGKILAWVTWRKNEELHPDCVGEFHEKVSGCMIWGSISDQKGKGPMSSLAI